MRSATESPKPLLVGEAPSRRSDPERPFSGRSGARLRDLLGRPLDEIFDLRNLFVEWPGGDGKGSRFDPLAARGSAVLLFQEAAIDRRDLVLVGKRAADAFGIHAEYLRWSRPLFRVRVAILPHPSGISLWWNDPENVERARLFLRAFLRA